MLASVVTVLCLRFVVATLVKYERALMSGISAKLR